MSHTRADSLPFSAAVLRFLSINEWNVRQDRMQDVQPPVNGSVIYHADSASLVCFVYFVGK